MGHSHADLRQQLIIAPLRWDSRPKSGSNSRAPDLVKKFPVASSQRGASELTLRTEKLGN